VRLQSSKSELKKELKIQDPEKKVSGPMGLAACDYKRNEVKEWRLGIGHKG